MGSSLKAYNKMNWTEPKPPIEGSSYYDHITTETPLGRAIIEWKSWKERPSYSITIGDDYIDTEYDLEEAKRKVRKHLVKLHKELSDFLFLDKMNKEKNFYFLDEADEGYYFIKSDDGDVFTAGYDYHKVKNVIKELNNSHIPIIVQNGRHSIQVCWDSSNGENNCKFEQVI